MSTQESAAPHPIRPEISPVEDLPAFPHAIPTPLMPLVGRTAEVRRLAATLLAPQTRLLTLTGPGGVGKTRLAIALAGEVMARFPQGVVFVPLADVREAALVLPMIARAMELPPDPQRRSRDLLISAIGGRRVLLVLDNLEHLPDAASPVADLVQQCPHLVVLATSRLPLHIRGEQEASLPPLALPEPGASLAAIGKADAIAFFLQVARGRVPDFALTEENAPLVVEICRRLDGLPLALELAASRLRMFPPKTLLRVLERRLDVLTGGPRDLPDRQRTLRDAIRWSYDLLEPVDQSLFRRLGVFVGGFTLETASEVLGVPEPQAMEAIGRLVDHHLVRPVSGEEGRFRMLETIREFALEALDEAGERDAQERAHAEWCRALVVASAPALTGGEQAAWFGRLDAEQDNLRAAMTWGLDHAPDLALQVAAPLWRYWNARGRVREGQEWVRRALDAATDAPASDRAAGLYAAGQLAENLMALPEAMDLFTRGEALYAGAGDDGGVARCLNGRGVVARMQGRLDEAEALHREALARLGPAGDRRETAVAFNALGAVAYYRGDSAGAERAYEQALAVAREIGDIRSVGMLSGNLGTVALQRGDAARAAMLHEEALAVGREMRDPSRIAYSLINLGSALTEAGEFSRAQERLRDGLHLAQDIGEAGLEPVALYTLGRVALLSREHAAAGRWFGESLALLAKAGQLPEVATALDAIGCIASELARHEDAVRLFRAAERIRAATGAAPEGDDPVLARDIAASRAALGAKGVRALEDAVRDTPVEAVVAEAREIANQVVAGAASVAAPEPDTPERRLVQAFGLTPREIEILGYLVDHRSDREIGDTLFISPRTVGTHVNAIRGKMGVTSRREAARLATEAGLGERAGA